MLGSWVFLFVILLFVGAGLNVFGLAGNWIMLGSSVVHALVVDRTLGVGYSFGFCAILLLLALIGEGLEFLSGIYGAGKAGGSRRAMVLSMIGGMIGSIFGFGLGNALVFLLGGIVGIFFFGGLGALVGAVLGERWKGSDRGKSLDVGRSAFIGRVLGTLAKSLVGSLMLVVAISGLFI